LTVYEGVPGSRGAVLVVAVCFWRLTALFCLCVRQEATAPKEMVVLPLSAHMMDTHREAACGAVRRWVLSVLVGAQVAADGEEGGRPVAARVVHVGKRPAPRPGEVKGREKWRIAPSQKRLERYCNEDDRGQMHPLAGLVGYSE